MIINRKRPDFSYIFAYVTLYPTAAAAGYFGQSSDILLTSITWAPQGIYSSLPVQRNMLHLAILGVAHNL